MMRCNKYLRSMTATIAVTLVALFGLQMMAQKHSYIIKSSNNTISSDSMAGQEFYTPYIGTTEDNLFGGLQDSTDEWEKTLQSYAKEDPGLFESLVSDIQKELRRENSKRMFEPVTISYQAALFNFSKFNPADFESQKPMIPHIIHQIWDSAMIPAMFKDWVRSIAEKHRDWEYWFWTVADAECLVRKKYPQYLNIFQNYPANIFRTDAFRYFVLYDYGGFYIDLDVEALKPLDFWTYTYPAVISWENYEHTYLIHKKKEPNLMTTVLASKPKHPFFKMLQEDLVIKASDRSVLDATGPFYLHNTYKKYMNSSESDAQNSTIMTIHPRYWLPKHDGYVKTMTTCYKQFTRLTPHGKIFCQELEKNKYANSIKPDSFLNHFWVHVNTWNRARRQQVYQNVFHIKDVVPNAKLVSEFLRC